MKKFSTATAKPGAVVRAHALVQPMESSGNDDHGSLAAWLTLALSEGVGNAAGRRLLAAFGLPGQVLAASRAALRQWVPAALADGLGRGAAVHTRVQAALDWAAQPGHHIVCLGDGAYPPALLQIADPPLLLYVRGDPALLQRPAVAVVGSRHATRQGVQHAEQFARQLSQAGLAIISGLALGIDAAAHAGGLCGPGSSVAVIGTGIDLCYPQRNQALSSQLAAQGCIVSEYALGTPPSAANFPRRNRLISGLAQGVLVVEAAPRSGSLITARLAADQGRDVFAIPGSIHSPLSRGCHELIRQGAKLVECTQDILDEFKILHPVQGTSRTTPPTTLDCQSGIDRQAELVIAAMGHDPVAFDILLQRCALDAATLGSALLGLELAGRIEVLAGGCYRCLG